MKLPTFSAPGHPPTADEAELIRNSADPWARLGQRIGVAALVAVLEEFGGRKQYIPARAGFFEQLFLPLRDAEIEALLEAGQLSQAEIGRRWGLSQSTVARIKARAAARKTDP